MDPIQRLVAARSKPGLAKLVWRVLARRGVGLPPSVRIGRDFKLVHRGFGVVIHPKTVIGDRVRIYQGVTVGRADPWVPAAETTFGGVTIEDDVMLCAGAKVVAGSEPLIVRRGSVVAANAVLTQSTGEWEIWAGVPAHQVSKRAPVD